MYECGGCPRIEAEIVALQGPNNVLLSDESLFFAGGLIMK